MHVRYTRSASSRTLGWGCINRQRFHTLSSLALLSLAVLG